MEGLTCTAGGALQQPEALKVCWEVQRGH